MLSVDVRLEQLIDIMTVDLTLFPFVAFAPLHFGRICPLPEVYGICNF